MMSKHKRLFDVTDQPFFNGIMSYINGYPMPWEDFDDIIPELDFEYYGNISGDKIVSPLIDKMLAQTETEKLNHEQMQTLANIIWLTNRINWQREWDTMEAEYEPIENYNMTETLTNDITETDYGKKDTRTDNLQHKKTGTEQVTPNITETVDNAARGFNSGSDVPTTSSDTHTTGTNTTTYNTTESDTGTESSQLSGSDTSTRNYVLTRTGNIGVTTSQQMLESERNLWIWNYFYTVIFPAVDRVLTIQSY